jgi:mono/diheme cytochrome c family protein
MRPIVGLCAVFLAAGVLFAHEGRGAEDEDERIARGKALAEEKCARCHAVGSEGISKHKAAPPFRDVAQRYPVENLAEALAEGIVSGHPDMPVFAFEPAEIGVLLAYLDHLRVSAGGSGQGK